MKFVLGAFVCVIVITWLVPSPQDKVVFLDVGQGDAILLQSGTRQVLIDGGKGTKVLSRLAEEMPLLDRRIEVVIATHPDQDHLEGLRHVMERYEVDFVLLPQAPHTSQLQEGWLDHLHRLVAAGHAQYRFAQPGQYLRTGDLAITVLGPADEDLTGATNNASVITRIDFHDLSVLLTGDAERIIETRLVDEYAATSLLDVDVLKAGHHGSNSSTHTQLLAAASPQSVVISVGENSYGHPHPKTLERLRDYLVHRTDELGSIRFVYVDGAWRLTGAHARLLGG